jgi:RNAse (barnase) inhibitor barstar
LSGTATYTIDGERFTTLESFFQEITRTLVPVVHWGQDLESFHDVLNGGFGTPAAGFTLRWHRHALSRVRLGYPETIRQLELRLQRCPPENRAAVAQQLKQAHAGTGPTVFDWLVQIVRAHASGATLNGHAVELVLD